MNEWMNANEWMMCGYCLINLIKLCSQSPKSHSSNSSGKCATCLTLLLLCIYLSQHGSRLSGFVSHVSWGGSVWDACVSLHASHTWCLQLPCVADLGGWCVDMCRIWDVCCLPAPPHQPFRSKSLDFGAPEEAYSRNGRALGTLKFGYESVFKILGQLNLKSVHESVTTLTFKSNIWC